MGTWGGRIRSRMIYDSDWVVPVSSMPMLVDFFLLVLQLKLILSALPLFFYPILCLLKTFQISDLVGLGPRPMTLSGYAHVCDHGWDTSQVSNNNNKTLL